MVEERYIYIHLNRKWIENDNLIIDDNEYSLSSTTTTNDGNDRERERERGKENPSLLANDQMTS